MDPLYYTRIAMAGWIYTAVILLSIYIVDSPYWTSLLQLAKTDKSELVLAFLGAVVGLGAPPALGFIFERITSLCLWAAGKSMWNYSSVESFKARFESLDDRKREKIIELSGPALFHILFYTTAADNLLEWTRRHRTQMYASYTSAIALIAGLVTVSVIHASSLLITIISFGLAIILFIHANRERKDHELTIATWIKIHSLNLFSLHQ